MSKSQFEEKEFEQAANVELSSGGFLMSPGQVLEKLVSYDSVASPVSHHVIWQLLNHPRPRGIRLLPGLWAAGSQPPADRLPRHPISLVLQYKRPEHLKGPRAAQWGYWRSPYYRFVRSEAQHRVLRRLDGSLEGDAVVRYAAPAFWRFADLEAAVVTGQVLRRTGFVRPADLKQHKVWTYIEPGTVGRANPSGRRLHFEAVDELFRFGAPTEPTYLPDLVSGSIEALADHLALVANTCRKREPALRTAVDAWIASVRRRDLILTEETLERVGHLVAISTLTAQITSTWRVIDALDPPALRA
jgi:hypothetical protein